MNIEQARFNMIEQQIRPWNVLDAQVLSLLNLVKRENFVPSAHQAFAFADMEIPLTPLAKGEYMLSPKVEARMLQDLNIQKHERVLEIGTGSGYMAALMAHRAQFVTTLELNPDLAKAARANLELADVYNAKVVVADGSGDISHLALGAFDVIVLSGSVASMPVQLLKQLKVGGRCMAIVGNEPMMSANLVKRVKDSAAHGEGEGAFETQTLWDTVAPRLHGFAEASRFKF